MLSAHTYVSMYAHPKEHTRGNMHTWTKLECMENICLIFASSAATYVYLGVCSRNKFKAGDKPEKPLLRRQALNIETNQARS